MRVAKVSLDDGSNYETNINGTDEDIQRYFIGQWFNFGIDCDLMRKCVNVEVIQ